MEPAQDVSYVLLCLLPHCCVGKLENGTIERGVGWWLGGHHPFKQLCLVMFGFHFFPKSLGHAWVNIAFYQQSVLQK